MTPATDVQPAFSRIPETFRGYDSRTGHLRTPRQVLQCAVDEVLDGWPDVKEAEEAVDILRATGNVYYTARGFEINADTLREAVDAAWSLQKERTP